MFFMLAATYCAHDASRSSPEPSAPIAIPDQKESLTPAQRSIPPRDPSSPDEEELVPGKRA